MKKPVTVEQTSKRIKLQILLGGAVISASVAWMIGSIAVGGEILAPAAAFICGLAWYAVARIVAWWHHG